MSVKKYHVFEKDYVWNPAKMENGKYLASIMGDSAIIYHKVKMRMRGAMKSEER